MKKILGIIIIFLLGYGFFFLLFRGVDHDSKKIPSTIKKSVERVLPPTTPPLSVIEHPARLKIPKLGIDAAVEAVGMDSQGRMDVPKNNVDVAWYQLGFKPGDKGNAVFAGHYDTVTGAPAVFYNLKDLEAGDKVVVTGASGQSLTFVVNENTHYPYNNFPLQEVFGASSVPRVNLITCEGIWDAATHNYSDRTVVYTTLQ